MRLQAF